MNATQPESNIEELREAFGSQTIRETPASDSLQSQIFGIYDRLYDHGHCNVDVVLAPANAAGEPDWENTGPANVCSLPADEWPEDAQSEKRACVIVSDIDGCDRDSTFIVLLHHETGIPGMFQIHGPEIDRAVADSIIGRDLGNRPTPKEPTELQKSMAKLTADLFAPQPAEPVAVNDNEPQFDKRLMPYATAYGGEIRGTTLFGATVDSKPGQIYVDAAGQAWFWTSTGARRVSLPAQTRKPLSATPFALRSSHAIPLREWLFAKHYMRRYLSVTVGAGGGGKSANSVSEVLAMVTGRPLLDPDGPLSKPLRVWYVNAEDPIDEIERRFTGAALHFGVTADQIGDRLFTDSGRDQEFVIVRQEGRDFKVCEPMVDEMLACIHENQIDVVIVDPFVSTHEVPENDNGLIQRVAKAWRRVADQGNCSIELIHHVTKGNFEVTADSARGGGALKDAARSVRTINPMTKDESEKAGLEDHRGFFRLDFGKTNMTASSSGSQWRRFVSVPLMNGTGMIKTGDEIGVVEAWRWPSKSHVTAFVSAEELEAIKRKMKSSNCRESVQANDWAGYKVAEALRINLTDAAEKKRVKRMLYAWKEAGHFTLEQRPDYKGIDRPCLVPVFHTLEN